MHIRRVELRRRAVVRVAHPARDCALSWLQAEIVLVRAQCTENDLELTILTPVNAR